MREAIEALDLCRQRQQAGIGLPVDAFVAEETLTQVRLDCLDAGSGLNKSQRRLARAVGTQP